MSHPQLPVPSRRKTVNVHALVALIGLVVACSSADTGENPVESSEHVGSVEQALTLPPVVTVGDDGQASRSTDQGSTWTDVSPASTQEMFDITYGGGQFVAVGTFGTIWRSADGNQWTFPDIGGGGHLYTVRYCNGYFVAGGVSGYMGRSSDGISWTQVTPGAGYPLATTDIACDNLAGGMTAVGYQGKVIVSSNAGLTWSSQTSTTTAYLYAVASAGGTRIAVGTGGTIIRSTNGTDWARVPVPGVTADLRAVAFGNGRWVVFGGGGTYLVSSDGGATWTRITGSLADAGPGLADVEYLPQSSRFLAVGVQGKGWYSDGAAANWTQVTIDPAGSALWRVASAHSPCVPAPAPDPDTDGDGLTDCTEFSDQDPWTDPAIFNGMNARSANHCHTTPTCAAIDTLAEVNACTTPAPRETKNQAGGWNWQNPPTADLCDSAYGFRPNWSVCGANWQVDFQGFIKLENGGQHCFSALGDTNGACGSIFFNNATTGMTSASGAQCFNVAAGVYPIRWFYETAGGPKTNFNVSYCHGGAQTCTPTAPLANRLLRAQFTPGEQVCDPRPQTCTNLCRCGPGQNTCTSDQQCQTGLVCGIDNGMFFGQAPGTRTCWDPSCAVDPTALGCGFPGAACGAVCGNCSSNCAGKTCGDDPSDGCGGYCPSLCDEGEIGCRSDLDCPAGTVCGIGMGPRFGGASGTNVCWSVECTRQDPSQPNCGVPSSINCGQCPACVPQCQSGSTGPDGCGGFCGECPSDQTRMPDGECGEVLPLLADTGENFPIPIQLAPPSDPPTALVGTIPGFFEVSDGGTAQYSIPIEVPPGSGAQPSLALNYSSTKSNGMLGIGWSLGGLSTITRCRRIHDRGAPAPVRFENDDEFCLDGQYLNLIPSTATAETREYRTEIDTFVRVIAQGPFVEGGQYIGPRWFTVYSKDGVIRLYGNTDDASVFVGEKIKRVWALDRIRSRAGTPVDIGYRQHRIPGDATSSFPIPLRSAISTDTGELLPEVIVYGGYLTASIPPNFLASRFVKFSYEDRLDPQRHYTSGILGYSTKRLTRIDTYVQNELVKSYVLGYEPNRPDQQSRLSSVRECYDAEGLKCKSPTQFTYNEAIGIGVPVDVMEPVNTTITLDATGFGRDEILGLGNSWVGGTVDGRAPDAKCFNQGSVIDLNRDGLDDLLDLCSGPSNVTVYLSQRPDVRVFSPQSLGFRQFSPWGQMLLADIDGDGLRDLLFILPDMVEVHFNTGVTFSATPQLYSGPGLSLTVQASDLDGDGAEELVQAYGVNHRIRVFENERWHDAGPAPPDYGIPARLMDANGDGLRDILVMPCHYDNSSDACHDPARFALWMNTGGHFRSESSNVNGLPSAAGQRNSIFRSGGVAMDFDGDGRDEWIVEQGYFRYEGPGQLQFQQLSVGPILGLADIDGDGASDLLVKGSDGRVKRELGKGAHAGLIKHIEEGFVKGISVTYGRSELAIDVEGPSPTQMIHVCAQDNTSFDTTCVRRVAPVVTEHSEAEHVLLPQIPPVVVPRPGPTYRYQYWGGRNGTRGRGFFGFERRQVTGENWTTVLSYHNDNILFAGKLAGSKRTFDGIDENAFAERSQPFEESSYVWQEHMGDFVSFPFISAETHSTAEGDDDGQVTLTSTRIGRNVDQYGTITSSAELGFAGLSTSVTITTMAATQIENRVDDWLLGLVKDVSWQSGRNGEGTSRRMRFDYDVNGLVRTIEREPGFPTESTYQKTSFTRGIVGRLEKVCTIDSRGTDFQRCNDVLEYDAWNISPRRIRDAEGLVTNVEFSPRTGKLLVLRDPNNQISEFAYDRFGRLGRVLTPTADGTISYARVLPFETGFPGFVAWSAHAVRTSFRGEGVSERQFDAFGRVVSETAQSADASNPTPVRREYQYDSLGRLELATMPRQGLTTTQGVVRYRYDALNRLTSEEYPDGSTYNYFYPNRHTAKRSDWFNDPVAATSVVVQKPKGNFEAVVRDPYRLPVAAIEGLEGEIITRYAYGSFNLPRTINARVGITEILYDRIGRRASLHDPALGMQGTTYTGFDELDTETDGEGRIRRYTRDRLGRPRELRDGASNLLAKWIYDGTGPNALGRLVASYRQAKPGATTGNWTRYRYQQVPGGGVNRGLIESIEYGIGGTPDNPDSGERFPLGFEYKTDVPWQLDVVHYPPAAGQAFAVQYEYDPSGGIKSVHPPGSSDPNAAYWQKLEVDQGFRLKKERFGNGLASTRQYYAGQILGGLPGRLWMIRTEMENQSSSPVQNVTFGYDGNGNLSSQNLDAFLPLTERYSYDEVDRLFSHRRERPGGFDPVASYVYDDMGNLLSKTGVGAYTYGNPAKPFQVTSAGGTTYFYNANGGLRERSGTAVPGGIQTFDYNDFDMPWRITTGEGTSAVRTELEYTAGRARLVKRELSGANPVQVSVDIGELYQKTSTYSPTNPSTPIEIQHQYRILAGGRQVAQINKTQVGGVLQPSTTYYLHDDSLGTTKVITDVNGEVVERRAFNPFGDETAAVDWNNTNILSGFTGHRHDPELGLVNMRGRLYDSRLSRFTTPDPFVTEPLRAGGLNRYSYVQNNPLTFVDPSGFHECVYLEGPGFGAPPAGCSPHSHGEEEARRAQEEAMRRAQEQANREAQERANERLNEATQEAINRGTSEGLARQQAGWGQPTLSDPSQRPVDPDAAHDAAVVDLVQGYRNASSHPYEAWDRAREDYRPVSVNIVLRDAEHFLHRYWLAYEGGFVLIPRNLAGPADTLQHCLYTGGGGCTVNYSKGDPWWDKLPSQAFLIEYGFDPLYRSVLRPIAELFKDIGPTTPSMGRWENHGFDYGWYDTQWEVVHPPQWR